MAEQNQEKLITTDTLYTFKLEQDLQNLEKFKLKNDSTDLKGAVRYDTAQVLEDTQKEQARVNIGAAPTTVVRFDIAQDLTDEQKAQVRANIGAGTGNGTGNGTSDYNELINRPVYTEIVSSTFDGNETPDVDSVSIDGITAYKVSDITFSRDDILGVTMVFNDELPITISEEHLYENITTDDEKIVGFLITLNDGERLLAVVTEPNEIFKSVGIYWALSSGVANKKFRVEYKNIKQLDEKYIPNNIPRLNESGLISAENLPSYVDDVVEGYLNDFGQFNVALNGGNVITPEIGKIYLDLFTNNIYRWSGSQYVRINPDEYTLATSEDIYALFNK